MRGLLLQDLDAYLLYHDVPGDEPASIWIHGLGGASSEYYVDVVTHPSLAGRRWPAQPLPHDAGVQVSCIETRQQGGPSGPPFSFGAGRAEMFRRRNFLLRTTTDGARCINFALYSSESECSS